MPYLIIPGWAGSGPDHWQSHWESELDGARRVEMPDWDAPRRAAWLDALDQAIRDAAAPPTLIAHSLGCIAVAHWAARASRPIRGALLVAPADLDRPGCPAQLRDFAPVPRAKLPFPAHVVASDDDPHATLTRARQIASDWGASVTVMRGAGHINCDAGFGPWREGRALLGAIATV
jgi:predicted alpha/beta hydrolase family esterase